MPLSILIWLPAVAGLLGALARPLTRAHERHGIEREPAALAGRLLLAGALGALAISVGEIAAFDPHQAGLRHVTDEVWIAQLGIHYKLGLDGLNLFMVALTTLLFAVAILAANLRRWERPGLFFLHFGVAESAVLGAFLAQDLALFVAFFDLMLIPFYFLTGIWGGRQRVAATTKLVIYTLVGSLLMLAAAVATAVLSASQSGRSLSFVLSDLQNASPGGGAGLSSSSEDWIFLFFAAAFLVKMPAFPLHGWMPDGYRAMPIEVLSVFSGVLSKVGAYGFLRIVLPLFPGASVHFQTLMLVIALTSILYGSAMAFTQTNLRLIAGYSSVAQLGFITLGIFALRPEGAQGALLQMVNHGLVVVPLFLLIAGLSRRAGGSEDIRDMGGIAFRAPVLAAVFLIIALATLAMPGSSNFAGEFLILLGVFQSKIVIGMVAFGGVVLASVYMLRAFIRAMHNRVGAEVDSRDIGLARAITVVPVVAVILFFAVYPQLALRRSEDATTAAIGPARALAHPPSAGAQAQPAPPPGVVPGGQAVPQGSPPPAQGGAAGPQGGPPPTQGPPPSAQGGPPPTQGPPPSAQGGPPSSGGTP